MKLIGWLLVMALAYTYYESHKGNFQDLSNIPQSVQAASANKTLDEMQKAALEESHQISEWTAKNGPVIAEKTKQSIEQDVIPAIKSSIEEVQKK